MKRIVFAKLKGGVGASTACVTLAAHMAKEGGEDIAVMDLDRKQLTAQRMVENFDGLIEAYNGGKHDYLFVDSGAGIPDKKLTNELNKAHLIIIPLRPAGADLHSTKTFVDQMPAKQRRKSRLLFTNVQPNTRLGKAIKEIVKLVGIKALKTNLNLRTGYALALTDGYSVLPPAARKELRSLALEVAKLS